MSIRSKMFIYKRENKDGVIYDYHESDTWSVSRDDYKWNESTEPLPVSGYFGTQGSCTVAMTLRNFSGRIYLQGTLATSPEENDWVTFKLGEETDYVEYTDTEIYNPMTMKLVKEYGVTKTVHFNIQGNFTFFRIVIDRDFIAVEPSDAQKQVAGKIEEALVNF